MKLTLLVGSCLLLTQLAAADTPKLKVQISSAVLSTEIPSGSGLSPYKNNHFLVIGDDSPYLFEVDQFFKVVNKTLIKDYPVDANGRIAKKIKPDFEAMTSLEWKGVKWNLIVGSGSKPDLREFAYLISENNGQRYERKLTALYAQLYAAGGLTNLQTLNIEGLAVADDSVYFFNRGNSASNMIFKVDLDEVINYMIGIKNQVDKVTKYDVKLPVIGGYEAGLSGAEYWGKAGQLVYTASVEATGDPINDGAILGSFVGVIPLKELREGQVLDLSRNAKALTLNGATIVTKIESIAISSSDDNKARGILVSDNDDGTSQFFNFSIKKD